MIVSRRTAELARPPRSRVLYAHEGHNQLVRFLCCRRSGMKASLLQAHLLDGVEIAVLRLRRRENGQQVGALDRAPGDLCTLDPAGAAIWQVIERADMPSSRVAWASFKPTSQPTCNSYSVRP